MLHPLEQVRDHQNPLAHTPALASCQAPQLRHPRCAAKEVCRHRPSPKCGTHAQSLYHISEPLEAGIRRQIEAEVGKLAGNKCSEGVTVGAGPGPILMW